MKQLVIFGAGGHAREVAQLVEDINLAQPESWQLAGFLADADTSVVVNKPLPAPFLGGAEWLLEHSQTYLTVAIGNSAARQSVVQRLLRIYPTLQFATLVHPRAWIAKSVALGQGCVVFAGSLVNADACLGSFASLNLGVTASHDCTVGSFSSLGPGVHLAGAVTLGEAVDVGTGASMRPGVSVGAGAIVGAGAVVVTDLPAHCVAYGVPAVVKYAADARR